MGLFFFYYLLDANKTGSSIETNIRRYEHKISKRTEDCWRFGCIHRSYRCIRESTNAEAEDLIDILDDAGNDDVKGYTKLKCKTIGKISRFYIDCVK